MENEEQLNWIEGAWCPARSGLTYSVAGRGGPWLQWGPWPRSERPDLERAYEALSARTSEWAALSAADRFEFFDRACTALAASEEWARALESAFGLERDEAQRRAENDLFELREGLEILRDNLPGETVQGVGLFRCHWSELLARAGLRLATKLVAGPSAVVLGDAHLPQASQLLVAALVRAGIPAGALALVGTDLRRVQLEALRSPRWDWVRWADYRLPLERAAAEHGPRVRPVQWRLLGRVSEWVGPDEDPVQAAARVLERSLGRSSTLWGQLAGQTGRVLCHQRVFSPFTEALLEALAGFVEAERPLPWIEPDGPQLLRNLWSLGLAEGSTPLWGESMSTAGSTERPARTAAESVRPSAADTPFGAGIEPAESAPGNRGQRTNPILFTNVEPHQRLARADRPAPVLCLLRVRSEAHARAIRAELDVGPWLAAPAGAAVLAETTPAEGRTHART